jgi:hypothetical protein
MMRKLVNAGIETFTDEFITANPSGAFRTRNGWTNEERDVAADLLVCVGYRESRSLLFDDLRKEFGDRVSISMAGDAVAPRRLYDAVSEGTRAGRSVGAPARAPLR